MSVGRVSKQIMRAIRVAAFGGPENLKLETNVPIPTPGPNEVTHFGILIHICRWALLCVTVLRLGH